jgi:hypothetical protein
LELAGESPSVEELSEMIGMIDTEGTNKVNYEDFHKFTTGKALAPIG